MWETGAGTHAPSQSMALFWPFEKEVSRTILQKCCLVVQVSFLGKETDPERWLHDLGHWCFMGVEFGSPDSQHRFILQVSKEHSTRDKGLGWRAVRGLERRNLEPAKLCSVEEQGAVTNTLTNTVTVK